MRFIVILIVAALLAFPTYLSDVSLILRKQGGPPLWEQHWWIYVAFCLAWLPIVWGITTAMPSLFGGLKSTAVFTGQQAAKNSDSIVFILGVLTAVILGPLFTVLALMFFAEFGEQKNNTDLLYFGIALFAWVPGGLIGGLISEKAISGSWNTVSAFAFFSTIVSACGYLLWTVS